MITVWDNAAVYIWLDDLKHCAELHLPLHPKQGHSLGSMTAHEQPIQLTHLYTVQVMQMKPGTLARTFADNVDLPQAKT